MSAICDAVEPHFTVLNDFMGEVLPDVNMLGSFMSANDVVPPIDARDVLLDNKGRLCLPNLPEPEAKQKRMIYIQFFSPSKFSFVVTDTVPSLPQSLTPMLSSTWPQL